ncbi:POC1 centriolar protein A [Serendipita sp. 396]|nr:POC1 centriolar protein A [Serendipita sp. 396]
MSTEWEKEGRLGGCFFFDKTRPETTTRQGFCDTLAAQLANNQPQLRSLITHGIEKIGPVLAVCSFEKKLQKLVIQPMKDVALVLVIDALDECDERDRALILRNLLSSLSQTPRLKILITSRPERDIAELLGSFQSRTESLHDIELGSNRSDIAVFVKYKMRGLIRSSELTNKEVQQLAKRVNCLFILASTACKVVQDSIDPRSTLRELLDPKRNSLGDINRLYSTILSKACKIGQTEQARASKTQETLIQILKVILVAAVPLTTSVIDALLGIKNTRRAIDFLSSVLNLRSDGTILILHPTFREFLENETDAGEFHINIADAHELVAKGCLQTMSRELCFNICRLESSYVLNKDIPDFKERVSKYISKELQYGCIYWPTHVANSNGTSCSGEIGTDVVRFTENEYPLYWMEVTSALSKVSKAIGDLQDIGNCSLEGGTKARINDIRRFLIAFLTPISESIPHIYISAIPLAPRRSYIRRATRDSFTKLMSAFIGCSESWPEPPREWQGHTSYVISVVFSPDGRWIVSGSWDKTIRLWDAETGQSLGEPLRGHTRAVTSVGFSPDGRRIVSGSWDETICLWDAETGQSLGEPLRGHTQAVTSVGFSPDGRRIVSGSEDMTIRLWDAETGQSLGEPLRGHIRGVTSVGFSPDGRRIVSGSEDMTIHLWDAETGQSLGGPLRGHTQGVTSVGFSPDGRRIVSGSWNTTIRLWDAETGQSLGEPLRGHTREITSVGFSPDGRRIVSGSEDTTIRLWDAETGQSLGEPLRGHTRAVTSVGFSPDGRRIVSGSYDMTICLWDAETGQSLGEPLRGHTQAVTSVGFSPDGRRIVSGSWDKTIRLWDAETGQSLGEPLRGHTHRVTSVGFSPDGRHIVSGSEDKTTRLWDAKTGQSLGEPLRGHTRAVTSVGFSPDGRHIVSGSWDETICLWDAETGQSLGEPLRDHTKPVASLGFSPDGRRIVSGSDNETIRLWDAQMGQIPVQPFQHNARLIPPQEYLLSNGSITFNPSQNSGSTDISPRISRFIPGPHFAPPCHTNSSFSESGWVSSFGKLLYWVPPDNRHGLQNSHILTIPTNSPSRSTWIDFTNFRCGTSWTECRK